jgi:hypothetical protein
MANPNPNPATRFGASGGTGNPSRAKQKGARDRLSAAFLNDFADDYDAHGKTVIETVRGQDPIAYMRIAAALLPSKIEISEEPPFTDEEIERLFRLLNPDAKPEPTPEEIAADIKARTAKLAT